MQQNMRAALYLMEREIRMAGYSPAIANPPNPITIAEERTVRFSIDLTGDSDTADIGERITYSKTLGDGNPLVRNDENGTGHAAAFHCGNKNLLSNNDVNQVSIRWPSVAGDFNDLLQKGAEVFEWVLNKDKS